MLEKINQSCLANPKNIKSIDLHNHRVLFVNGDVEDFSRNNNKRMREYLNRYNYQIEKLTKQEIEDNYIWDLTFNMITLCSFVMITVIEAFSNYNS